MTSFISVNECDHRRKWLQALIQSLRTYFYVVGLNRDNSDETLKVRDDGPHICDSRWNNFLFWPKQWKNIRIIIQTRKTTLQSLRPKSETFCLKIRTGRLLEEWNPFRKDSEQRNSFYISTHYKCKECGMSIHSLWHTKSIRVYLINKEEFLRRQFLIRGLSRKSCEQSSTSVKLKTVTMCLKSLFFGDLLNSQRTLYPRVDKIIENRKIPKAHRHFLSLPTKIMSSTNIGFWSLGVRGLQDDGCRFFGLQIFDWVLKILI